MNQTIIWKIVLHNTEFLDLDMRNWFLNCFARKGKASDNWWIGKKDEVEDHEQRKIITDLPDQSIDAPADRISGDRWSEREENKNQEKLNSAVSCDRISDLPDDVLHIILSFLPSKAIGQTSVLSRRWSHVWSSYPIFDFYEILTGNEAVHRQMRARIINTVLASLVESNNIIYPCHKVSLTSGRLGKFERVGGDPDNSCLARVEEFVLNVSFGSANTSTLPQCHLKCHSIRSSSSVSSKQAWLGFPCTYVVWSYFLSLQDLTLKEVDFSGVDLFSISPFPFLKKLCLDRCRGITALKICCPNLKDVDVSHMNLYSMHISGMRLEMLHTLGNRIHGWVSIFSPNLQTLYWGDYFIEKCFIHNFPTPKTYYMTPLFQSINTSNTTTKSFVINLLSHSSQAEKLELCNVHLKILLGIHLPFSFGKLKTLTIRHIVTQEALPALVCLLKNSPFLHTLNIPLGRAEWKLNNIIWLETRAQYFGHLKVVKIGLHFSISENAITFAKILLTYGTGLQDLILELLVSGTSLSPKSLDDTVAFLKGIPRASANVKFSTVCY